MTTGDDVDVVEGAMVVVVVVVVVVVTVVVAVPVMQLGYTCARAR